MPKETTQSLKKQLKLLERITETISYNLNFDEVLADVVSLVSDTMKADSCLIYVVQDKNLILKASKIPHPKMINKVAMKFGEGITGTVAKTQKKIVINTKAYEDKRNVIIEGLPEDKWEAFISVPLIYKKNLVGVINVQHKKKKKYTQDELKLLETIAAQVGGSIRNAKLFHETRLLKQALETRKLVEKAKGLLMAKKKISEEDAYKVIRKKSMDMKRTMKEVAEAIIMAFDL